MIQKAARDFAVTECLQGVIERDEHQKFPKEQIMKLGELGFMGMMVDPAYGGAGLDTVTTCWQWKRSARLMRALVCA